MGIYIVILILLGAFSLFKRSKFLMFISFMLLLIVGGLRDLSVGTDTLNYLKLYEYGDDTSFTKGIEWGYTLLQQFVYFYFGDYTFLVFIQMFLILLFFYIFITRESSNPLFSVFTFVCLYYWLYAFNTTRQYIAIPLVLIGLSHLGKGKLRLFLLFVLLAMFFHTSAFFTLVVLLFYRKKFSPKIACLTLLLSFIIGLTPLIPTFMSVFIDLFNMLGLDGFSMHISDFAVFRAEEFSLSRLMLTIYGCLVLITFRSSSLYVRVFFIGIVLLNIFSYQPVIARLAQYFLCIQIILIPNLALYVKNKKNRVVLQVISLLYMVITFFYLLNANVGEVVPYKLGVSLFKIA